MTDIEFDEEVDQIMEDVGEMIGGRHLGAVNCALVELLFMDVASKSDFEDLVAMINDIAQATFEDGFERMVTLQ